MTTQPTEKNISTGKTTMPRPLLKLISSNPERFMTTLVLAALGNYIDSPESIFFREYPPDMQNIIDDISDKSWSPTVRAVFNESFAVIAKQTLLRTLLTMATSGTPLRQEIDKDFLKTIPEPARYAAVIYSGMQLEHAGFISPYGSDTALLPDASTKLNDFLAGFVLKGHDLIIGLFATPESWRGYRDIFIAFFQSPVLVRFPVSNPDMLPEAHFIKSMVEFYPSTAANPNSNN